MLFICRVISVQGIILAQYPILFSLLSHLFFSPPLFFVRLPISPHTSFLFLCTPFLLAYYNPSSLLSPSNLLTLLSRYNLLAIVHTHSTPSLLSSFDPFNLLSSSKLFSLLFLFKLLISLFSLQSFHLLSPYNPLFLFFSS